MNDCHVHVGPFQRPWGEKVYFSPQNVITKLAMFGVNEVCIMSLSIHDHDLTNYRNELQECIRINPNTVKVIHWITYQVLKEYPNLECFEDIHCCAYKVHEYQEGWPSGKKPVERILAIARERKISVMIHTGGRRKSFAGSYFSVCKKFQDVKIVLAHGRPINETIMVMKECGNVYVDTAFMPIEDFRMLIQNGLAERVIFGTDYPINRYFLPGKSDRDWYFEVVNSYKKEIGEDLFCKISNDTFHKVFH